MSEAEALITDLALALIGKLPKTEVPALLGHTLDYLHRARAPRPKFKPFTVIEGSKQ